MTKHYFAVGSKAYVDLLLAEGVDSILMSFAYARKGLPSNLIEASKGENGVNVMLDSGGFTNSFKPGSVTLEGYCDFLKSHKDSVDEYIVLDDPLQREVTIKNYEYMLSQDLAPLIVDHMWFDLQEPMYKDLYKSGVKVCWGGMSSGPSVAMGEWVPSGATRWGHISSRIDERYEHAKMPPPSQTHLLAVGQRLRKFLPYFDSVDSFDAATWMRAPGQYGSYPLFVPETKEQPYPKFRQLRPERQIPDQFWQKAEEYGLDPRGYADRIRMTVKELLLYYRAMDAFYEKNRDNPQMLKEVSLKKREDENDGLTFREKAIAVPDELEEPDLTTVPSDDLIQKHWELHKKFTSGSIGGSAVTDLADEHAEVVDALYMRGVLHPPPPDAGLDEASAAYEDHKNDQPCYYKPPAEWPQLKARKKSLADLTEDGLVELRKFLLPSIDEALSLLEGPAYDPIQKGNGAMIALYLDPATAKSIVMKGGESPEELHCTLGYFGKADGLPLDFVKNAKAAIEEVCRRWAPLSGSLGGVGRFNASETSDGKDVIYASVDLPGLPEFRHEAVKEIELRTGAKVSRKHGYSPHVTLAYVDSGKSVPMKLNTTPVFFDALHLTIGAAREAFQLTGKHTEKRAAEKWAARITFPIFKIDNEERLMTGVVLEPNEVDAQNDTVQPDIIKKAGHRFLTNYGRADGSKLGLMHKQFGDVGLELCESWIAPMDLIYGTEKVKKGSWVMTVKAISDELWAKVKRGDLTGFSIGGIAALA